MVLTKEKYLVLQRQLIKAAAKLKTSQRTNFTQFIPHFIDSFSVQDIESLKVEDAFRHALALFNNILASKKGEPNLHIFTPSQKTYIHLIVPNMPFIIASLLNIFVQKRIYVHSQQNFILKIDYKDKRPFQLGKGEDENIVARFVVEVLSKQEIEDCSRAILSLCLSLSKAATDWHPIEQKFEEAISSYQRRSARQREDRSKTEFLYWLKEKRCIFLGYYEQEKQKPNNSLGICHPSVLTPELKDSLAKIPPRRGIHFVKTQARSIIHRPVYLDMITIGISDPSIKEYRFLILYAFAFFNENIESIPYLNERLHFLLSDFNAPPTTYRGRVMRYAISSYPRDQLVQLLERDILRDIVAQMLEAFSYTTFRSVLYYDEKRSFANVVVVIPREDYDTQVRSRMQKTLHQALGTTHHEFSVLFTEMRMALVFFTIPLSKRTTIDQASLIEKLRLIGASWERQLRSVLLQKFSEQEGIALYKRSYGIFPASYKEDFPAEQAAQDIKHLMSASRQNPHIELVALQETNSYKLRIFDTREGLTLSRLVHLLENSGADLIASRFYHFNASSQARLVEIRLLIKIAPSTKWQLFKETYQDNISAIYRNEAEDDSFNRLSLVAVMPYRYISLLRALSAYLAQVQGNYSQDHIEAALCDNPTCARILTEIFHAKFSPQTSAKPSRYRQLNKKLNAQLELVQSLEQDQILRQLQELIMATDRTNFYLKKQVFSFKVRPQALSYLSEAQPLYELFVYSAAFEGVHLRAGPQARGGIRWSDRRASYRLEIYNLLRAQIIKNAIIVPTGAKGGFYIKNPAFDGESIYRQFIDSLLELTDNLEELPPPKLRIYDKEDPYLVVAPDKGTAAFSDIANEISRQRSYWLDDAFASSGSSGYNHKQMGITARGAWESVCRLFAELGIDANKDSIEVIGVGDMSGDVFGNGMLLSSKIKLIAAFNHRAIFIDPNPDPATSFRERKRLFELPHSSWQDYNKTVLSTGGAIFDRQAKKLKLNRQIRKKFAIREQTLTPDQLISRILAGRADLLWFGGIGTYVKARHELNAEVGDKGNDSVRISANELKVRVIGEGANLGMTMAARIEFANHNGKLATDSNDNSGGVHSSDQEVNIKILLSRLEQQGKLTRNQRNRLLKNMTSKVAEQVLAENYNQNLALSLENWQAASARAHHIQIAQELEIEAELHLSSDSSDFSDLPASPLTRPQLSVLMGYYKNSLKQVFHHPLDYDCLGRQLPKYYPPRLRSLAGDAIFAHPLANRILATLIVNELVDHLGFAFSLEESADLLLWAQCFYQLDDLFSFVSLTQSLASHYAIYPQLLPFLHGLKISQLNALGWLKQRQPSPPKDSEIKKWQKQVESYMAKAPTHPFFNYGYSTLAKLGIDSKQAAAAAIAYEADSLILLLPLVKKENSASVLELYHCLRNSLALSSIQQELNRMLGQGGWRRSLAQDMWLDLGKQLSRIIESLLAKKTADPNQAFSEWRTDNQRILTKYHRSVPRENMNESLIQFLIGLLKKLS